MKTIENKIDFILTIEVRGANPNGDPLNGNLPREDMNGYGEISDVCIKRKIRNRLQDYGEEIFVQSNDRLTDDFLSLQKRFENVFKKADTDEHIYNTSCEKWIDVRSFGQVITYMNKSIGIRGPVSIGIAKSLSPIAIRSMQITRSTNGMEAEVGKRSSDTMGTKHYIDYGVYLVKGSINCFFAEKTGFTENDSQLIKQALLSLFENDASSARPEGSMEVKELFWITHPNKTGKTSTAKIFSLLEFEEKDFWDSTITYSDYGIHLNQNRVTELTEQGVTFERLEGN